MTSNFTTRAKHLLSRVHRLVDRYDWLAQHEGWHFNVFDVLDRTGDEVKGHSAMIAALLDPNGAHGQGTMFLKPFLRQLSAAGGPELPLSQSDPVSSWSVRTEVVCSEGRGDSDDAGRMDVVLETRRSLVVIENKVYAGDQWRQLERYHAYLQRCAQGRRTGLVYLTIDGRKPSRATLGNVPADQVTCMAYQEHIDTWLDECIRATALLPRIRETLVQYQAVVRRLAGRGVFKELTMEIVDLLVHSPESVDNLRAADEITKALTEAQATVQFEFWKDLEAGLNTRLAGRLPPARAIEEDRFNWALVHQNQSYKGGRKAADYGLGFALPHISHDDNTTVVLFVAVWDHVYYGLRVLENGSWHKGDDPEDHKLLKTLKIDELLAERWPGWLGVTYPNPRLNFRAFDEECRQLADPARRSERIDKLVEEIQSLVDLCTKRAQALGVSNQDEPCPD